MTSLVTTCTSSIHVLPVVEVETGAVIETSPFRWRIPNFGSVIKSVDMMNNQKFHFEAGKSLDLPVKMEAGLRKTPVIEKRRMLGMMKSTIEKKSGIEAFIKLVQKPDCMKEVIIGYEIEIKDSEEKTAFKHESPEENILPVNHHGMSFTLMDDYQNVNLPLIDGTLIVEIKLKLVAAKPAEFIAHPQKSLKEKFEEFAQKSLEEFRTKLQHIDLNSENDAEIASNDGTVFGVNRKLLIARCPVFQRLLWVPGDGGVARLQFDDISSGTWEVVLSYIYCGTLKDNWFHPQVLGELTILAYDLHLDLLLGLLDDMLGGVCVRDNAEQLAQLAKRYSLKTAEKELAKVIARGQKRLSSENSEMSEPTPAKKKRDDQ